MGVMRFGIRTTEEKSILVRKALKQQLPVGSS